MADTKESSEPAIYAFFGGIGRELLAMFSGFGAFGLLFVRVIVRLFRKWPSRKILLLQMFNIGPKSLVVVLTTGCFTGAVIAVQSYFQFKRMQVETMLGAIVGVTMVKELGPVLTGLMLAGRVGAAMTAELGTMKVTEQIDALEAMATDPISHLILPRFVACVLLMPILAILSDTVGILGGYFLSVVVLDVDHFYYVYHTKEWVDVWDILGGLIKSSIFGALMCLICCYKGFNCGPGASGVGKATTESVVTSSITILISDFFLTVMLFRM